MKFQPICCSRFYFIVVSHCMLSHVVSVCRSFNNVISNSIDFPQETDDTQTQREITYSGKPR